MAPAAAGDNYGGCSATVSDPTPSAGDVVTITGSGAADGGEVTATLDGDEVGSGTADAEGDFSFDATIPDDASGSETLSVSCGAGRGTFPLTVSVLGSGATAADGGDELPRTGSSSKDMTLTALGTIAGGAALVALARRRAST